MNDSDEQRQARLIAEAEAEIAEEQSHTLQEEIAERPSIAGASELGRFGRIVSNLGRYIWPRN